MSARRVWGPRPRALRRCGPARKREGSCSGGVAAVVSVAGGRDDVDGETEALSFDVVRLRRSLLRGVATKAFPLALCRPPPAVLVQADTLELRGAESGNYINNAVLDVVVVRPRRSLLRGVVSEVFPLALCHPFSGSLGPGDTIELRGAVSALHRINAVLHVVVDCLRRAPQLPR